MITKDQVTKYGTLAVVGFVAAVTTRALQPSPPESPGVSPTLSVAGSGARVEPPVGAHGEPTRLVSCGGRASVLDGDDRKGHVIVPDAAKGRCTVVFAQRKGRVCMLVGGHGRSLDASDLVVDGITGGEFTYTCE